MPDITRAGPMSAANDPEAPLTYIDGNGIRRLLTGGVTAGPAVNPPSLLHRVRAVQHYLLFLVYPVGALLTYQGSQRMNAGWLPVCTVAFTTALGFQVLALAHTRTLRPGRRESAFAATSSLILWVLDVQLLVAIGGSWLFGVDTPSLVVMVVVMTVLVADVVFDGRGAYRMRRHLPRRRRRTTT